jgi:hypothetical protein
MKNIKILLLFTLAIFSSCDLEENPPFLDESVYTDPEIVVSALDGIYAALTTYNAQERRLFVINGYSGFFNTRKQGGNINNPNNKNLFSLKPRQNEADVAAMWAGLYTTISRANAAIANIPVTDPLIATQEELVLNDVYGQAKFIRAWSYFSLVRLFGDVPLWTELPSSDNFMIGLSDAKEVYLQILDDAESASSYINGAAGPYYVKKYGADMLMSKVYMTLATNSQLVHESLSSLNFWQEAYDSAKNVYDAAEFEGHYALAPDYASLFTLDNENSTESIFELQISQVASNSQMGRNYTPNNYKAGQAFGWFTVNADIYDDHANTYPNDPRLAATFISEYTNNNPTNNWFGSLSKTWPSRTRANFRNSHPFLFKYAVKDVTHSNQYDDKNIVVYRYAELLLMLAEISNELQNGEQLSYVTQVLNRVNLSNISYVNADQSTFRDLIMKEYRYELLGEGEDAHNNRRRGFDYFLDSVIIPHNTTTTLSDGQAMNFNNKDLTLSEDPNQAMFLPLPLTEINTNELIN